MFITKQTTLSDTQRGLLFKDKRFIKVLNPGKYRFWGLNSDITVEEYELTDPAGIEISDSLRHLMNLYSEKFTEHLNVIKTAEQEIALVYQQGNLHHIIPEASEIAFWNAMPEAEIRKQDISADTRMSEQTVRALNTLTTEQKLIAAGALFTVKVAENERAVLFRNQLLIEVLETGIHSFWNNAKDHLIEKFQFSELQKIEAGSTLMQLIEQHEAIFSEHIMHWETRSDEVGLVYNNAVLCDILPPGKRGAYWKSTRSIEVRKMSLTDELQSIAETLAKQFRKPREVLLQNAVRDAVISAEISDKHIGFLIVDGKLQQILQPGAYAWWKFNRNLLIRHLDMRLQNMEVNGQEILSKDRVSLRINLSATWQVIDAEKVVQELADATDYLYRELQLALRSVVSTRTLDELLEDKNLLNQDVLKIVSGKVAEFGIELKSTGVKDIILPGEMKEILAQVVEAQKAAEANLIRRREETQATRSLHNTAKVMEGNPTLLRLKELEVLEKITSQISTLNVYGGLDGVMNDMVKLTDKT